VDQNKQLLFLYIALAFWFYNREEVCLLRGTSWVFKSDRYRFELKGLTSALEVGEWRTLRSGRIIPEETNKVPIEWVSLAS
jgi:hypothetical protein